MKQALTLGTVIGVVLVLASACSDGNPSTPDQSATSAPTQVSTTAETVSPVPTALTTAPALTSSLILLVRSEDGAWTLSRVAKSGSVTWDTEVPGTWNDIEATDSAVLLDDGSSILEYDLADGKPGRSVFDSRLGVSSFALSPDHARLAITTRPRDGCLAERCSGPDSGALVVVHFSSGAAQYALHGSDARLQEGLGVPGEVRWFGNSDLVLGLSRYSSSAGSSFMVNVDGDVVRRIAQTPDVYSSDSTTVAIAIKNRKIGCENWPALELRDLLTWGLVARLDGRGSGLLAVELSPDGKEALVERREWTEPPATACSIDPPEPELVLLSGHGARQITSNELRTIRQQWFGLTYLAWSCPEGLLQSRQGNSRFGCELDAVGQLAWDGVPMAEGATVVALGLP